MPSVALQNVDDETGVALLLKFGEIFFGFLRSVFDIQTTSGHDFSSSTK